MALTLYANPYDTSAKGFYFKDADEYVKKADALENEYGDPVEEFSIEFIDGDEIEQKLFKAMSVSQANVEDYLELVDDLDEEDMFKISVITDDLGYSFEDALDKYEDLIVYGEFRNDVEFAQEYVDGIGSLEDALGDNVQNYFDYASFGRNLRMDGYGTSWKVEYETSDDDGELDEEFFDWDEADEAGRAWLEEAEDDGEEDPSYEVVEVDSNMSDRELGEEFVDSAGWEGVGRDNIENYFDWDQFARDLMMDMAESDGTYYDPNSI